MVACASTIDLDRTSQKEDNPNKNHKKIKVSMDGSLIDNSQKETLGLPYPEGLQRIIIFEPNEEEDMKFNNHPQLVA